MENIKKYMQGILHFTLIGTALNGYRRTLKDTSSVEVIKNEGEILSKLKAEEIKLIEQYKKTLNETDTIKVEAEKIKNEVTIQLKDVELDLNASKETFNTFKDMFEKKKEDFSQTPGELNIEENIRTYSKAYQKALETYNKSVERNGQVTLDILNEGNKKLDELISPKLSGFDFQIFQDYVNSLNVMESGALFHLLCAFVILSSLFNIITIILGNKIIDHFELEIKFPKLANYLKFRATLQKFNIKINLVFLLLAFFIPVYVDFCVLFGFNF